LAIIVYGAIASMLPVWLRLAPCDYLSTFLKIGVIVALAIGIYLVQPDLKMEAVTRSPAAADQYFPAHYSRFFSSPSRVAQYRLSRVDLVRYDAKDD
jgi:carbon starvation protein CstA